MKISMTRRDWIIYKFFMLGVVVGMIFQAFAGPVIQDWIQGEESQDEEIRQSLATEEQLSRISLRASSNEFVKTGCSLEDRQCHNYCVEESVANADNAPA